METGVTQNQFSKGEFLYKGSHLSVHQSQKSEFFSSLSDWLLDTPPERLAIYWISCAAFLTESPWYVYLLAAACAETASKVLGIAIRKSLQTKGEHMVTTREVVRNGLIGGGMGVLGATLMGATLTNPIPMGVVLVSSIGAAYISSFEAANVINEGAKTTYRCIVPNGNEANQMERRNDNIALCAKAALHILILTGAGAAYVYTTAAVGLGACAANFVGLFQR